jgi:LPS export ABC transporter protein LptC
MTLAGFKNADMIKKCLHSCKFWAAFFGSCFFIWGCENDPQTVRDLGKRKIGIEEARQIESFLSQDGKVKAKLTAPLMLRYQLDTVKVEFPKSLHVNFFDDSLKIESQLNAKYGRYLETENKVFLRDSVIVFNVAGDTLHAKELYWDQQKQQYYTDKNVIVIYKNPPQKVYGTGLVADQALKNITIHNPKGFMIIPDSTYLGY